jgi:hypothetical protein
VSLSQKAFDFIIREETDGQHAYETRYMHPDWPGGRSGVTIGIGYDCGYATPQEISEHWGRILPPAMVLALCGVAGIHGAAAHSHAHELRGIVTVSWSQALEVYQNVDVPRTCAELLRAIPGAETLPPDSFGALASITFNRGDHWQDAINPRYAEMHLIYNLIMAGLAFSWHTVANKKTSLVGDQIRGMKRLWPDTPGLRIRRDAEAALYESGLGSCFK